MKENLMSILITMGLANNGQLKREDFINLVDDEEQEHVEQTLSEKGIIVSEMLEEENVVDIDDIAKKCCLGTAAYDMIKAMESYKRLTAEDEARLASKVTSARIAKKMLNSGNLNLFEREKLEELVKEGRKAKDHIIYSYHPLVLKSSYRYNANKGNVEMDDIILSGFTALNEAFNEFDFESGNRLGTFAYYRIKNAIQKTVAGLRNNCSVPQTAQYQRLTVFKMNNLFYEKYGRDATDEEVAYKLGANKKNIEKKAHAVRLLRESNLPSHSLNATVNVGTTKTYADYISSSEPNAMDIILKEENEQNMLNMMKKCLTLREQKVIFYRFGVFGYEKKTLKNIGLEFGLSRERIRQIETESIEKMKLFCNEKKEKFIMN